MLEVRAEFPFLMAQHQIFKRIKDTPAYPLDLEIIRKHHWQFLLEHQYTGRDRGNNIPSLCNQPVKNGEIGLFGPGHGLQITHLQLWHTATLFLPWNRDLDAIQLKYLRQIFTDMWLVIIAITGSK